jgi:hypothetical protein
MSRPNLSTIASVSIFLFFERFQAMLLRSILVVGKTVVAKFPLHGFKPSTLKNNNGRSAH